jgi:hypothetical protein
MARRRSTPDRWVDSWGRVIDEEDRGLVYDLRTLVSRRSALGLFGALGAGPLVAGCAGTTGSSTSDGGTTTASGSGSTGSSSGPSSSGSSGDLTVVPDETGGPYPGDGSNGVAVLDDSGIVRSDIRSTFGSATTTTADGVPLTIRLTLTSAAAGAGPAGRPGSGRPVAGTRAGGRWDAVAPATAWRAPSCGGRGTGARGCPAP